MAASELDDHTADDHSSFIRTPKQLLTVVVLAFVVPITVIVMVVSLVSGLNPYDADHPAMTDEAIARRIQPVGQVTLAEGGAAEAPAPAPATTAPPAAAPAPAAPPSQATAPSAAAPAPAPQAAAADGKAIFDKVCMVCHSTGLAGAPKAGDKAAWAPRLAEGMDAVYSIALHGKGAMPPKGGAAQLSDAEVKAAVDYMVSLVK